MDDHIPVIEQHPPGIGFTFAVERQNTFFFKEVFDFIIDSFQLTVTLPGTEDEVISEAAHVPGIEEDDIDSLLVTGCFYGFMS